MTAEVTNIGNGAIIRDAIREAAADVRLERIARLEDVLREARPAVERLATEEARGMRADRALGVSPRPAHWRDILQQLDAALEAPS